MSSGENTGSPSTASGEGVFCAIDGDETVVAVGGEEELEGVRLESNEAGDSDCDKQSEDEDGDAESNSSGLFEHCGTGEAGGDDDVVVERGKGVRLRDGSRESTIV